MGTSTLYTMGIIHQDAQESQDDINNGLPVFGWLKGMFMIEDPVETLTKHRMSNKFWPFHSVRKNGGEPVFQFRYYSPKFVVNFKLFILAFCFTIIGVFYGMTNNLTVISLSLTVFAFFQIIRFGSVRKLEIEEDGENYYFYRGNRLDYTGNVSDIYIRLRREKCTNGINYFYLTINGYNVDEVMITDYSSKYKEYKRHGKRIAYQLNLNYFDFDEISCEHAVRHMISIDTFTDSRVYNTSISETGKRMTDLAKSDYGVGNYNNRNRAMSGDSDIVYNDQDMEQNLADKALGKVKKRDSMGKADKERSKSRNSSAFGKRLSSIASTSRAHSVVDALF